MRDDRSKVEREVKKGGKGVVWEGKGEEEGVEMEMEEKERQRKVGGDGRKREVGEVKRKQKGGGI